MRELHWRLLLFGVLICILAAAATPYIVLKLGMSLDLTYGGMFLAAALLGRHATGRRLANELNIIQTMINAVTGVGFMCVILAAFYYIQTVFGRNIGFNPAWWKIVVWLLVSANLGVFMGAIPRRMILNDPTLPWPTGQAVLSVAETLTDPAATASVKRRRDVLQVSTSLAGFLTLLKDGFGVIPAMVGKASINMAFGPELAMIGLGMLIPLGVGLSGLLGLWFFHAFGETVAKFVALNGTSPEYWGQCRSFLDQFEQLTDAQKVSAAEFLTAHCGKAMGFVTSPSHFKFVIQWMMWPATAMMLMAALTSVIVPLVRNAWERKRSTGNEAIQPSTMADEFLPWSWIVGGIAISVLALVWLQSAWFSMPWRQVLVAVAIQPILIVAGVRVLGLTGQGPVSLMANATQFLFGLIWPAHIQQNLNAAHIAADPQSSAESTMAAFWVARRLGGRFRTLVVAQLLVLPIGAFLLPLVFKLLEHTYGIGLQPGQLSAPTGLKIASLAIVMEKGLAALPHGALTASIIAGMIGIVFELLLAMRKRDRAGNLLRDAQGNPIQRFGWVPIASAVGFALILPPALTLALATGSVISGAWRTFSTDKDGSYTLFAAPLAAGLVAGEAIVGGILLPVLGVILELLKPCL